MLAVAVGHRSKALHDHNQAGFRSYAAPANFRERIICRLTAALGVSLQISFSDEFPKIGFAMYSAHPQFITPDDNVTLWRYMDVARFLAFIQSKSLYFARVFELGDPWEAAWPSGLKRRAVEELGASGQIFGYYQLAAAQGGC
jgi:hypothetical protein